MGNLLNVLKVPPIHSDCVFCDVTSEKGFNVVAQNDKFIAFHDRNPASKVHILVIPKDHHRTLPLSDLAASTSTCVSSRATRLLACITHATSSTWNLGFHIPPFNSVNHLHLHVQVLPYRSSFRKFKYRVAKGHEPRSKGFSWFVTLRQAISILDKGDHVGVLPC
ncbi:HIT-like domain-containing protein [Schizophyllum fasciatum]